MLNVSNCWLWEVSLDTTCNNVINAQLKTIKKGFESFAPLCMYFQRAYNAGRPFSVTEDWFVTLQQSKKHIPQHNNLNKQFTFRTSIVFIPFAPRHADILIPYILRHIKTPNVCLFCILYTWRSVDLPSETSDKYTEKYCQTFAANDKTGKKDSLWVLLTLSFFQMFGSDCQNVTKYTDSQ